MNKRLHACINIPNSTRTASDLPVPVSYTLPCPTRSQKRRSRHTLPIPARSSHFLTPSLRSLTSPRQTPPTQRRRPSLSFSFSTARLLATSAGATGAQPQPGTHSGGRTPRCTRISAEGRCGKRRDRRMATRFRARRREICVVCVRKICLAISSVRVGRDGEVSIGGKIMRTCCSRYMCRTGASERVRKW